MGALFHELLVRPLFNALILLYDVVPGQDLGVAIILLTLLVRLILFPLVVRQFRSQRRLTELQPKVEELRKSVHDRGEQSRRLLQLYREHGVSPASGCLPLIPQLPILWAMYLVLRRGLDAASLSSLYAFVPNPGAINPQAFGFLNLAAPAIQRSASGLAIAWPALVLALLTGAVTYWQLKLTPTGRPSHPASADKAPAEQLAHRMSQQMRFIVPLTTVYFTLAFPTGLALYWFVTTLVAALQQWVILRPGQGRSP